MYKYAKIIDNKIDKLFENLPDTYTDNKISVSGLNKLSKLELFDLGFIPVKYNKEDRNPFDPITKYSEPEYTYTGSLVVATIKIEFNDISTIKLSMVEIIKNAKDYRLSKLIVDIDGESFTLSQDALYRLSINLSTIGKSIINIRSDSNNIIEFNKNKLSTLLSNFTNKMNLIYEKYNSIRIQIDNSTTIQQLKEINIWDTL